jgi:hypothetical protein
MMTVEEAYFEWLCHVVLRQRGRRPVYPYVMLCAFIHGITFKATVPNDDNRASEGRDLRTEFLHTDMARGHFESRAWVEFYDSDATIFEVLVALARRCDFQVELGVWEWFHIFLTNLHLDQFDDNDFSKSDRIKISKKINPFNNRTYSPSGAGGIFPLKRPLKDQRTVELWYQMSAYILENDMIT